MIGKELATGGKGINEVESRIRRQEHYIDFYLWGMIQFYQIQLRVIFEVENHNSRYRL